MTSFVIMTDDDENLGFILFASHDGEWPPAGPNDVVFAGAPQNPALNSDPAALFVAERKGREHRAEISYSDTEMQLRIAFDDGFVFTLLSDEQGNSWTAVNNETKLQGTGLFL